MKVTSKRELMGLPIGAHGTDRDDMLIRKVSTTEFEVCAKDTETWIAYDLDEVAGAYAEDANDGDGPFLPLSITGVTGRNEVRYEVTIHLPEHDMDLVGEKMRQAIEERLNDFMPHYMPLVKEA